MRDAVANALYWNLAVPRYRVTVEVDGGLVTLHGFVERAYEKSSAEATVRRVPGVVGVRNEIAVRAPEVVSISVCTTGACEGPPGAMTGSLQSRRFGRSS